MAHPAPSDLLRPTVSALQGLEVVYRGRNAHAAGAPWEGRNALDAMVVAYSAISALRQQLPPGALVHGVITHGGDKPNIIPSLTRAEFIVRARERDTLAEVKERVAACFRAGAEASGCELEVREGGPEYLDMRHCEAIVGRYADNLGALGAPPREDAGGFSAFSTDMGNVSHIVPSIHPVFGIPAAAGNHTPEFTEAAAAPAAQDAMIVAAKAMAMTALDLLTDAGLRGRARADFDAGTGAVP
jgi:metal-dependent amidase/aminoacylase/carboxypeptidase family protein